MKVKIKGKGHPQEGGWSITDENDVPVLVEGIEINSDGVKMKLFECPDVDVETNATLVCLQAANKIIEKDGRKIALCEPHVNALHYLTDKGLLMGVGFDFDISEGPKCPLYTCGQRIDV